VPHPRLKLAGACLLALTALLAGAAIAGAGGSIIEYENLVLRADGGFTPRTLPRHHYAPIEFKGHFEIGARSGGQPPALERAVIKFDRDGRLGVAGLPTCPAERVANLDTAAARRSCRGAIVGSGRLGAVIAVGPTLIPARAQLTVFNAPRVDGHPAVLLHARTSTPTIQTYAIVSPIERLHGEYGYQVTIDVPPLYGGRGAITHLNASIGRRYRAGGKRRSYVAARCSDNILRTRGSFQFAGGLLVEGSVEKFCRQR
jgi:hypothetical protein